MSYNLGDTGPLDGVTVCFPRQSPGLEWRVGRDGSRDVSRAILLDTDDYPDPRGCRLF